MLLSMPSASMLDMSNHLNNQAASQHVNDASCMAPCCLASGGAPLMALSGLHWMAEHALALFPCTEQQKRDAAAGCSMPSAVRPSEQQGT